MQPLLWWKINTYCIFLVCIFTLRCNTHALYCHLWPGPLYKIFPHYRIDGRIFGGKKLLNVICVLIFSTIYICFNTVNYVILLLGLRVLIVRQPWLRFFRAFSSVVRRIPGYNSPSRSTARTIPIFLYCSFVLFYVLFILCRSVYCLCVNVYCTTATVWQLTCN